VVSRGDWAPDRGDVVWMNFSPQIGREQAGYRPALTLSPASFNRLTGLGLFCPVRSRAKGYPFEVLIPAGLKIQGAILTEQARTMDWRARRIKLAERLPASIVSEALARVSALLA